MSQDKFQDELEILKFWQEKDIYNKSKKKNEGSKSFVFVDGPPYPTGEAHMGHMRNWAIKDSVLRFRRLLGQEVYAKDGYDVHGLPVENKVQKKLNLNTVDDLKKFGEENFVKECKKYIAEIIGDMREVRERYGLWMDREHYQTSHPEYLSMAWRFFKKAQEKGLLYKDYKSVAWCPHDETTLSDYEIKDEYKMLEDPSIYVKFPLRNPTSNYKESFLIWTTTPWTLQSNMAIAMNPEFNYAKVLVELNSNEEVLIIAEPLVESVIQTLSKQNEIKLKSVIEVKKGIEFDGTKYEHIYLDETPSQQDFVKLDNKHVHSIIMADFVTLSEGADIFEKLEQKGYKHSNKSNPKEETQGVEEEANSETPKKKGKSEGTGLVHIAPGHGFDDYEMGKKYNIPIFSPVNEKGIMSEGKYKGTYFKDVDPIAIEYLREKGYLLSAAKKTHKYPCCWRCKTPIVYRAADQWWIRRSKLVEGIIKENSNVKWYPEFARSSFNNLMNGAGDWAISRQRFWGIPLPIFEDEDGNYEVFGSKEELEKRLQSEVSSRGYETVMGKPGNLKEGLPLLEDIHRDDLKNLEIVNEKSGKVMKAVPFIADVWFDSGCASFASHYNEGLTFDEIIKKYYPMTWITESEDQIRGWFSSLFNVGYMVTGIAPYNSVLYYKFVMAKDGQKMSKSLGNGVTGNEAIEKWGADMTRYYLLVKRPPEDQINFDPEEMSTVEGFFNTLKNIFKLISVYLEEHDLKFSTLNHNSIDPVDKWIMHRLNTTIRTYTRSMEEYKLNVAFKELEDFIIRDFSKTYLKIIKERLEERDEELLVILNEILKKTLLMLAPACPFTAEKLYQETKFENKKESIFLDDMPVCNDLLVRDIEKLEIDRNFDLAQEVIQSTLNAREKAKIGVRWPLGGIDIGSSVDLENKLKVFEPLIKKLTNISKINYSLEGVECDYIVKPNFATIKVDFENVQDVIKAINLNKFYIVQDLKEGKNSNEYEGLTIDYNKHIIKEMDLKGDFVSSDFSKGILILETHQDEVLLEEGYLRELIRRVQDMRKNLGLNKKEEISISFSGSDEYYIDLVNNCENTIMKKVGASDILQNELENREEFSIKDRKLVVSVNLK